MNERVQRRIVNFIGAAVALSFLGYFVGIPLMIGFAMVSAERRDCEQMTTLAKDGQGRIPEALD
jgi:Sec-independent protein secretion pathway component TatC